MLAGTIQAISHRMSQSGFYLKRDKYLVPMFKENFQRDRGNHELSGSQSVIMGGRMRERRGAINLKGAKSN